MAKYESSPFGRISGAVSTFVGGDWKGRQWIRARVTPSNPRSDAQAKARASLAEAFEISRRVFSTLYGREARKLRITKKNIFVKVITPQVYAGGGPEAYTWNTLLMLPFIKEAESLPSFAASYDDTTGDITITWTPTPALEECGLISAFAATKRADPVKFIPTATGQVGVYGIDQIWKRTAPTGPGPISIIFHTGITGKTKDFFNIEACTLWKIKSITNGATESDCNAAAEACGSDEDAEACDWYNKNCKETAAVVDLL